MAGNGGWVNPFLARRLRATAAEAPAAEVVEHQVVENQVVEHQVVQDRAVDVDQVDVDEAHAVVDVEQGEQNEAPAVKRVRRSRSGAGGVPARNRAKTAGRKRSVLVRLSDAEYEALVAAAAGAGLTPTGYVAEVAVAAATGGRGPVVAPEREALLELVQARTQLRRYGTNVNQAIAALNAVGEAPVWLREAVERTSAAVERVDRAAALLARRAGR
jgi:uncharacterized protein (DUF1778 family)